MGSIEVKSKPEEKEEEEERKDEEDEALAMNIQNLQDQFLIFQCNHNIELKEHNQQISQLQHQVKLLRQQNLDLTHVLVGLQSEVEQIKRDVLGAHCERSQLSNDKKLTNNVLTTMVYYDYENNAHDDLGEYVQIDEQ